MPLFTRAKDLMVSVKKYGALDAEMSLFDAASLFKKKKHPSMPIFIDGKFSGILKSEHIVKFWVEDKLVKDKKLKDFPEIMKKNPDDYECVSADTPERKLDCSGILTFVCDDEFNIIGIVP